MTYKYRESKVMGKMLIWSCGTYRGRVSKRKLNFKLVIGGQIRRSETEK